MKASHTVLTGCHFHTCFWSQDRDQFLSSIHAYNKKLQYCCLLLHKRDKSSVLTPRSHDIISATADFLFLMHNLLYLITVLSEGNRKIIWFWLFWHIQSETMTVRLKWRLSALSFHLKAPSDGNLTSYLKFKYLSKYHIQLKEVHVLCIEQLHASLH